MIGTLRSYISLALGIGMAAALLWGARVDHLRAEHKTQAEQISQAVAGAAGVARVSVSDAASLVAQIGRERLQFLGERDDAIRKLNTQGESIRSLGAETERLKKMSAEQRQQIASLLEQRDAWIAKADAAATREERLSAEAEAKQCEEAADALYNAGF